MSGKDDEPLVKTVRHDDGAIVEILLNRPRKRNALNQALLDSLLRAIEDVATGGRRDKGKGKREKGKGGGREGEVEAGACARVVILGGVGPVFCAGMDLKSVVAGGASGGSGGDGVGAGRGGEIGELLASIGRVMRAIRCGLERQVVIARVQGAAIGGGCGLMTVCDLAVTHTDSKIGYPEVDLGVCPAVVAPWLIRKIGAGGARRMLLAGGTMSGVRAWELGLVTGVVGGGRHEGAEGETLEVLLEEECLRQARAICRGGAEAIAVTKRWLNELEEIDDAGRREAGDADDWRHRTAATSIDRRAASLSARVAQGDEAQRRLRAMFSSG